MKLNIKNKKHHALQAATCMIIGLFIQSASISAAEQADDQDRIQFYQNLAKTNNANIDNVIEEFYYQIKYLSVSPIIDSLHTTKELFEAYVVPQEEDLIETGDKPMNASTIKKLCTTKIDNLYTDVLRMQTEAFRHVMDVKAKASVPTLPEDNVEQPSLEQTDGF